MPSNNLSMRYGMQMRHLDKYLPLPYLIGRVSSDVSELPFAGVNSRGFRCCCPLSKRVPSVLPLHPPPPTNNKYNLFSIDGGTMGYLYRIHENIFAFLNCEIYYKRLHGFHKPGYGRVFAYKKLPTETIPGTSQQGVGFHTVSDGMRC